MKYALTSAVSDNYSVTMKLDQTKSQILNGIASAASGADSDDVFLFYYSGHGSSNGSLVCIDLTYISTAELYNALSVIPGKVIVILDSCFSGQAIASGSGSASSAVKGFTSSVISAFSGSGTIRNYWGGDASASSGELATSKFMVITASSASQTSLTYGNASSWRGLMTEQLLAGAGWNESGSARCTAYADTDGNKTLTLKEAYTYTYSKVNSIAAQLGATQSVQVYPANSSSALFHLN